MKSLKNIFLLFFLLSNIFLFGNSSNDSLNKSPDFYLGIKLQKYTGFYMVNGFYAEKYSQDILKKKIGIGVDFITSSLGSAISGNAIPFWQSSVSVIKPFLQNKKIQPLVKFNLGFAMANYGSDTFKDLPNKSLIAALEVGLYCSLIPKVKVLASGGYNLITGSGSSGLGVIYPVYGQITFAYEIKLKEK